MKTLKQVFVPEEFDSEKRQAVLDSQENAKAVKNKAIETVTRFEQSLNELDSLLRGRRKQIDTESGAVVTRSD